MCKTFSNYDSPYSTLLCTVVLTLVTRVTRQETRQYLHRGSCLFSIVNVIILPVSEPELSSLGDGSIVDRGIGEKPYFCDYI